MFKPHFGDCSCCGKPGLIVVKKGLRKQCNERLKKEKRSNKNAPLNPKKKKTIAELRKMVKFKQKRKATGELARFKEIWNERPHICEVSGDLIRRFDIRCFSHILSKGAYPSYRLFRENILLITPEMHQEWEFGSRDHPRWIPVLEKAEKLKSKYYRDKKIKIWQNT